MAPHVCIRFRSIPVLVSSLVMGAIVLPTLDSHRPAAAAAQTPADDSSKTMFIGVIEGDDVYVRSGAGPSYYPFFKLNRGDLVRVTGENYGFVSVALVGPAFRDAFGYVKHSSRDAARVRMAADGKSATTLGRVDIIAPNLEADHRAKDSWKVVARLEADQSLQVLESTTTGEDTIYKVAMPSKAVGWITAQLVTRAPADEAAIFEDILAGRIATPTQPPEQGIAAANNDNNTANQGVARPATPNATPVGEQATAANAENAAQQPITDGELIAIAPVPNATSDTAAASQPDKPREPTWEDLEKAFKVLQQQPVETAELQPMRDMYAALAERHPDDQRIQRFSDARIDQIEVWQKLQQKKLEVLEVTARMKLSAEDTEAARLALERSAEYVAVGRVAVSNIYDGSSLPKLFRLQDPATGRTVAYLKPDADYALANRIDVIVGIVGDKSYDESLRLNLITPRRIDALSPEARPATTSRNAAQTPPAVSPDAAAPADSEAEDK